MQLSYLVQLSLLVQFNTLWGTACTSCLRCGTASAVGVRTYLVQAFLRDNKVRWILRSHEGPDARAKRPADDRMPSIDEGFCVDHETPCKTALSGCCAAMAWCASRCSDRMYPAQPDISSATGCIQPQAAGPCLQQLLAPYCLAWVAQH